MIGPGLVEHFFRHEYGRLVATLARRVGVRHIGAIEDAAQTALMKALEVWQVGGPPDNPSAWLYRVAHNALMGELRQRGSRRRILEQAGIPASDPAVDSAESLAPGDVRDDLLRMLFVCCDDAIPPESRLVLALKTLCGFSVREIALRLFTTDANVYKRLGRARNRLRRVPPAMSELGIEQYASRLLAVTKILYVLFAEGYLSSGADTAVRMDLCEEAIRLCTLLAQHPVGRVPEVFALNALMHLHMARMTSRQDASGGLLLLEEQDRASWDRGRIGLGLEWLVRSAQGPRFSRYHAEAGIAAEHCLAPSFQETRWDKVVECYGLLEQLAPSPLHMLNRAVAVAELRGPATALATLAASQPPPWLTYTYLWNAVLADLHRRCDNTDEALRYRDRALAAAPSPAVKDLLQRRLGSVAQHGAGH